MEHIQDLGWSRSSFYFQAPNFSLKLGFNFLQIPIVEIQQLPSFSHAGGSNNLGLGESRDRFSKCSKLQCRWSSFRNNFNLPPLLEFLIIQHIPIKLRVIELLEACLSCCFSVRYFLKCSYHEILNPELRSMILVADLIFCFTEDLEKVRLGVSQWDNTSKIQIL